MIENPEAAGHLQTRDLIDEVAEAICNGMWREDGGWASLHDEPMYDEWAAETVKHVKEVAAAAIGVLRRRNLITEQGLELLKRRMARALCEESGYRCRIEWGMKWEG